MSRNNKPHLIVAGRDWGEARSSKAWQALGWHLTSLRFREGHDLSTEEQAELREIGALFAERRQRLEGRAAYRGQTRWGRKRKFGRPPLQRGKVKKAVQRLADTGLELFGRGLNYYQKSGAAVILQKAEQRQAENAGQARAGADAARQARIAKSYSWIRGECRPVK